MNRLRELVKEWRENADTEHINPYQGLTLENCADELESALADMWQPIETAPQDGTHILVTNGRDCLAVAWAKREQIWWIVGALNRMTSTPTHWMPLPKPPAEKGGEDDA